MGKLMQPYRSLGRLATVSYTHLDVYKRQIMSRVTSEEASELLSENKALRRRLEEALLRLEGYEIMGEILQEEYLSLIHISPPALRRPPGKATPEPRPPPRGAKPAPALSERV